LLGAGRSRLGAVARANSSVLAPSSPLLISASWVDWGTGPVADERLAPEDSPEETALLERLPTAVGTLSTY
jgi:hypothetical protein